MLRKSDTDQPCLHLAKSGGMKMIEKMGVATSKWPQSEDSKLYEIVHNILEERWNKSNTPLHCLAHSLNPRYYSTEWLYESPNRHAPHKDLGFQGKRISALKDITPTRLNGEL